MELNIKPLLHEGTARGKNTVMAKLIFALILVLHTSILAGMLTLIFLIEKNKRIWASDFPKTKDEPTLHQTFLTVKRAPQVMQTFNMMRPDG